MVKAMPVFRYFDYGRSVECAPSKKGDPSTPCIIAYIPETNSLLTSSQTQVGSAEPPRGTSKAGSNLVAHDQDVPERRPPEIIPT